MKSKIILPTGLQVDGNTIIHFPIQGVTWAHQILHIIHHASLLLGLEVEMRLRALDPRQRPCQELKKQSTTFDRLSPRLMTWHMTTTVCTARILWKLLDFTRLVHFVLQSC